MKCAHARHIVSTTGMECAQAHHKVRATGMECEHAHHMVSATGMKCTHAHHIGSTTGMECEHAHHMVSTTEMECAHVHHIVSTTGMECVHARHMVSATGIRDRVPARAPHGACNREGVRPRAPHGECDRRTPRHIPPPYPHAIPAPPAPPAPSNPPVRGSHHELCHVPAGTEHPMRVDNMARASPNDVKEWLEPGILERNTTPFGMEKEKRILECGRLDSWTAVFPGSHLHWWCTGENHSSTIRAYWIPTTQRSGYGQLQYTNRFSKLFKLVLLVLYTP